MIYRDAYLSLFLFLYREKKMETWLGRKNNSRCGVVFQGDGSFVVV